MHCPICQTENAGTAEKCKQCGNSLSADSAPGAEQPESTERKPRPGRRRALPPETDSAFADWGEGNNRTAQKAYRLSVYGIIPGLGLVLGPVAAIMGWWTRRVGRDDPDFKAQTPAIAAFWLGLILAVTQWGGLALMIWGLCTR